MDESYHGMLAEGVEKKMRELEVEIMKDVIRRVRKAGTITETADWQVQRLYILGNSSEDINKLINKAVYGDEEMVRKLYDEVIEREYTQQKEIYETSGNSFIPYEKNIELQQLIDAMVKQGTEDLFNITKSTGFVIPRGEGGRVFLPMAQMYNDYLDGAITGMVSGAYDYNTLVRKLVNQMTSSGLRTSHNFSDGGRNYGVDYMSGHHNRIDVAARRALLTGFSQVAGQVTEMNARKLGTNYFEVSWHGGARPDHAVWQGRVYSREELRTVCGLGEGGGLLGWNCRHSYYPFIPGISERQYSDEWLEQKAAEEAQVTVWRGKEYNTYQATQRQRQLETSMRAQRERVQLLREGGADPDDITIAQCKYQAILEEYRAFSSKMKLPTQMERVYTGRTPGRISPSPQTYAAWQAEQINKAKERTEEKRRKEMNSSETNSLKNTKIEGIVKSEERAFSYRGMANGPRRSPLTVISPEEESQIRHSADILQIPQNVLRFNVGRRTGFDELDEVINVRGDIYPSEYASNPESILNERCALAHEYYGHYKNHPSKFSIGDWRDEFRASYRAALDAPNLTDEERGLLMLDAYDRAKEAGVSAQYNKNARRIIYGFE